MPHTFNNTMKIYVIGDSISIHYGTYLESFLNGIADYSRKEGEEEALLNLDNPQGANAGDSSMVLRFLKHAARVRAIEADLILVNSGLHDIKSDPATGAKQVPLNDYRANLRGIIDAVGSMRISMAWVATTPVDDAVHNTGNPVAFQRFSVDCEAYHEAALEVMREANIPVIDLHTFTRNLGSEIYSDHVHFHEPVREKQAAFIAGWLQAYPTRC